jgi:hypothetical protein
MICEIDNAGCKAELFFLKQWLKPTILVLQPEILLLQTRKKYWFFYFL